MRRAALHSRSEEAHSMDENSGIPYLAEAIYLAKTFSRMQDERDWLKRKLDGSWVYTKDMAIADLDSITVSYEGERVQSSNISNPTERIALKLTDEYMAGKQAEMDALKSSCERELSYTDWKIGVVDAVGSERLEKDLKVLFKEIFIRHRTFKETEAVLRKKTQKKVVDRGIVAMKNRIFEAIANELALRGAMPRESEFLQMLTAETSAAQNRGGIADE